LFDIFKNNNCIEAAMASETAQKETKLKRREPDDAITQLEESLKDMKAGRIIRVR
jgi:hypothetical protein